MQRKVHSLLLVLTLSGCSLQPRSGATATQEPLSIHTYTKTHKETREEKVGTVTYEDSRGRKVGEGSVYAEREYTRTSYHWRPMQGSAFISDEDAFRIAGDDARADAAHAYRKKGKRWFWTGLGLTGAGLGLTFGLLPSYAKTQNKTGGAFLLLGSLIASGGMVLGAVGYRRMSVDGHPYSAAETQQAIDTYNRSLGEGSNPLANVRGVTVSGRF